jgi:methanethiol S-methyltransferase
MDGSIETVPALCLSLPGKTMPMNLLIFGAAIAAYFALHSILASRAVKYFLMARFLPQRYYRLIFNGLSIFLLLPLTWFFLSMEKAVVSGYLLKIPLAGWISMAIGVGWIIAAFRRYDLSEFSGFLQVKSGQPPEHDSLNTAGVNAWVRHPLYFGTLLVVWGWFIISPTDAVLLLAVLASFYTYIGARLEERKLVQQFGEAYRLYQREVPMLLPLKWWKK